MKKTVLTLVQLVVTACILVYLFRDPEQNRRMLEALRSADKMWIVAGLLAYAVLQACAIARWQLLLRVQGVTIGWGRLVALVLIGVFFNLFMPGGTGGDVVRIFYLLKEVPGKKTAALLTVLMDRLVGMLGLVIFAGVLIVLRYQWLTQTRETSGLLFALVAFFVVYTLGLAASYALASSGLAHRLPERFPMRDKLLDLAAAYHLYGRAWRSTLGAVLLSFPVHFLSYTQFFCAARSLPEVAGKASLFDFVAIMPIVNTMACIPVSFSGAGVREALMAKLLGNLCGIPAPVAVVASLIGFSMLVFWGLIGGVVYFFYRPSEHARLAAMESEVGALEHRVAEGEER